MSNTEAGTTAGVDDERLYDLVDVLDDIAESGRAVPQVALNWLLAP
ncbi:hypothetical protein OG863_15685 [Streptomyces decoyicus]|uniref:Uncharacterized protein n=1 Tax=Streptomyces decoyicus TaxID=249567 RepID=A0ABZ1FW64_9ACTN|nr:hypothetical protein [Streptomyces decoyicus]WSB74316.1 hypothetical protein OG863_15685 [Streptomyces decoyicus]